MASRFKPGDKVRAKSSWTGRSQGTGTVVTAGENGCGVALDRDGSGQPAHFYDAELSKVNGRR